MFTSKLNSFIFLLILGCSASPFAANSTCTLSLGNAAFGNFAPLDYAAKTITVTLSIRCTLNSGQNSGNFSGTITFSKGSGSSFTNRYMLNSANQLAYNIYKDSACTQVLGDGTGGTFTYSVSGNVSNSSPTLTAATSLYARIPSQPTAYIGNYIDNIVATLTYN